MLATTDRAIRLLLKMPQLPLAGWTTPVSLLLLLSLLLLTTASGSAVVPHVQHQQQQQAEQGRRPHRRRDLQEEGNGESAPTTTADDAPMTLKIASIRLASSGLYDMMVESAQAFLASENLSDGYAIEVVPYDSIPALDAAILGDVEQAKTTNSTPEFAGWFMPHHMVGDLIVEQAIWPLPASYSEGDSYDDLLTAYRTEIPYFAQQRYLFPFDGDIHNYYFRQDLFDAHNITPAETWDEYIDIAQYFHGRNITTAAEDGSGPQNITLAGSCFARQLEQCVDPNYYWYVPLWIHCCNICS